MHRICLNCKSLWWSGENFLYYCKRCRKTVGRRIPATVDPDYENSVWWNADTGHWETRIPDPTADRILLTTKLR